MQLVFYLLLFILAVQSCQGLVLAQKLKAAGLICTVSTWFLWSQQPGSRNKTIAAQTPKYHKVSLAGSVVSEQADVTRIGAREYPTFMRVEPRETRIGAEDHLALPHPQANYWSVEAGEHLKYVHAETNETSIGAGEQLGFMCTEESTSTRVESPNRSVAPIEVNDTTAAANTTHTNSYLHAKAINPTIAVRPEILKQLSRQNIFSGTASTLCCCLATIFVLVIYQLLVYGSSLHIWLYDLGQKISANTTCLTIGAIGNLSPQATDAISSINQLPLGIFSCIPNGFRHGSDCNNIVSPEKTYEELRKLRRARDRQSLKANRLHTLKWKRRVNAKATNKRVAEDFKKCHDHWHGIFEEGFADILRQVSEYSHMEQRLNSISALCIEAEKSLVTHVTKISNLLEQLDNQMEQLAVAIPNSTTSIRDLQSLVTEINKLLIKSESADAQVHRAERIIKTLYNVGERMQMAPFTDTLKCIAEAGADAQRIIYNAESAIVAANFAQRDPNQLFGPAIVAAREAQCPLSQNLLSGLSAFPEKTVAEAPIAEQLSPSAVVIGDTPLSTEINGDVSKSPRPSPSDIDSELPPPEVKMSNEATTPRRLSSTVITANSPPLNLSSCPQSPLVLTLTCFPTPSPPSQLPLPSTPIQTAQPSPILPARTTFCKASAVSPAGQNLRRSPSGFTLVEPFAQLQTAQLSLSSTQVHLPPEAYGLPEMAEHSLGHSFDPVSAKIPSKPQCPPIPSLAVALEQRRTPSKENAPALSTNIKPEKGCKTDALPVFISARPVVSIKDALELASASQPEDERMTEAPYPSAALPTLTKPNDQSLCEARRASTPVLGCSEPEERLREAPHVPATAPCKSPSPLPAGPVDLSDKKVDEAPCTITFTTTDITMDDDTPPSRNPVLRDENLADMPSGLTTPPFSGMNIAKAIPTHCLADSKGGSMAKMSPGWGSFIPNTAPEDFAVRGKDCVNYFGHLSELQEWEDTTKFSSAPLTIPNQPLVFSSRTQEFGKFKPKVPTHRWNAPKGGIIQKAAPGATSTVLKAPLRENISTSTSEFKPTVASTPAPPTVSIATIKSEPSEPTIGETGHGTGALKSNRINQAVFDQIQLTDAREIKKAVSRLAKPAPHNPPAWHVSATQLQGTPITVPEAASEGAPQNASVEDNRAFPAYDGDSTFEGLLANIGGCGYTMDPMYNTDSSYGGTPLKYSDSGPNDAFAYSGYTPYSGDNDEDAYSPSNVVYPLGYEEILGPIADYQIDAAGLDNYDFNNGLPACYPPLGGDQIDSTGLDNYDFLNNDRLRASYPPLDDDQIDATGFNYLGFFNDDGLPASYPPLDGGQIDATGLNYCDFLNDDELPASYPLLDDVSRLLNEDWNDTSHVDALLLAERAEDDGNDSDGDDHHGDEYNSDTNGYGSYGNLSDYDSDQF